MPRYYLNDVVGTHQDRVDRLHEMMKNSEDQESVKRAKRTLKAFSRGLYREPRSNNTIVRH